MYFYQFFLRKFLYLAKNYLNIVIFASVQFAINALMKVSEIDYSREISFSLKEKPIKLMERSIYSAKYCFVENLHQRLVY